jgi:hypothetical protein
MITSEKILGINVKSRSRRRWVVAVYWLLVGGAYGLMVWSELTRPHNSDPARLLFPLQTLIFMPALLGGVRAGGLVKPFRGIHWAPVNDRDELQTLLGEPKAMVRSMTVEDADLDERETRLRDRVHFLAYTVARWLALGLLLVYVAVGLLNPEWIGRMGAVFFYGTTLALWSLPQSLILWNVPDVDEAGARG